MIYEMARDIEERLRARKFPLRVYYGPEHVKREDFELRVVMMRDLDADDQFRPPAGQRANARKFGVRDLAVVALVVAYSAQVGAHRGDHERICEAVVDGLVTEIESWVTESKGDVLAFTGGRYLVPAELELEQWPGVIYALRFRVPRGVSALTYQGEARPEGAPTAVQNQTQVKLKASEDEPPETGCGA